jgi:hypothetical protein
MANRPAGFFQEPSGERSMGRLMAFIMLLASIGFGVAAVRKPIEQSGAAVQLVVLFLTAATCTKTIPKFAPSSNQEDPGR